jgi:hypothetical protein
MPVNAATGKRARTLAARLTAHGYHVVFPLDRDPAAFKVADLPGGPDVEVCAEDDGSAGCLYTGRTRADAAPSSAGFRYPVTSRPRSPPPTP